MNSPIALTIAGLEEAQSLDELRPVVEAFIKERGFCWFGVIIAEQFGLKADKITAFSNLPEQVISSFTDEDFYLIDPLQILARNSRDPFIWSQAVNVRYLEPEIQRIYNQASGWRIGDGVTVPVWHPDYRGNVGFSTDGSPIGDVNLEEMALVSYVLFEKVMQYFSPHLVFGVYPSLSEVEIELLRLASTGMSSRDIETALELPKRTVDYHFAQAVQRLGAKSRTHAIIRAYRLNFFEPFKAPKGDR